jgi:hypothetical protein
MAEFYEPASGGIHRLSGQHIFYSLTLINFMQGRFL